METLVSSCGLEVYQGDFNAELKEKIIEKLYQTPFYILGEELKSKFENVDFTKPCSFLNWEIFHIQSIPNINFLWQNNLCYRTSFVENISWSVPTKEVIEDIVDFSKNTTIKDYCSGLGYWPFLISQYNQPIEAFDCWDKEHSEGNMPKGKLFFPVKDFNIKEQIVNPNDTIFFSWIPLGSNMANNILNQMVKGQKLILIGEGEGGCTASDDFFEIIKKDFEEVEKYRNQVPRFDGINDYIQYLRKK